MEPSRCRCPPFPSPCLRKKNSANIWRADRAMQHYTEQQRDLVRHVFAHHNHFDADTLIDDLKKADLRVSRATVYRTLSKLVDAGLLHRLELGTRTFYEHDYGYPQHEHLVCERCGRIIEFQSPVLEAVIRDASAANGSFKPAGTRSSSAAPASSESGHGGQAAAGFDLECSPHAPREDPSRGAVTDTYFFGPCKWMYTPCLFDVIMSGLPSPLKSATTNCVPIPESLSISRGVNETVPSFAFFAWSQYELGLQIRARLRFAVRPFSLAGHEIFEAVAVDIDAVHGVRFRHELRETDLA